MAQISGSVSDKIYPLKVFLGLNENPDGDTKLKMGEASVCQNWKVTRDRNLQRRPGLKVIAKLGNSDSYAIMCLWTGYVAGYLKMVAAYNGKLYKIYDGSTGTFGVDEIGSINTSSHVHIFGFASKAYILDGSHYKEWDGTTLQDVAGYIPLIGTGIGPEGSGDEGGELLEQVNKLSLKRRAWISPDGSHDTFTLPEKDMNSIDYVKNLSTGNNLTLTTDYTVNTVNGQVTFTSTPTAAANAYEIGWTMKASADISSQVKTMKFSEIFSGATDSRVFLYGDGSNKLLYSGMDYNGDPRADYFPDLNEIAVGDSNTPVTGVIRHYSRLNVYKINSTWTVSQSSMTLADGSLVTSYNCIPVNRSIGNAAPGQVYLVLNSPRTLFGDDLYEWKSNNAYSGNLTADERQAHRISDRIYATLRQFNPSACLCWDDNDNQEYYICYNGTALVHNYAADAWYSYTNFDAVQITNLLGNLYIGTSTGRILKLDESALADDGEAYIEDGVTKYLPDPIEAYWESGSISFNAEFNRKYSSALWVNMKPQSYSYVEVSVTTDRKREVALKSIITTGGNWFDNFDFNQVNFADYEMPTMKRLRIKAKKFSFYKLIFQSGIIDPDDEDPVIESTATIISADIRVRETGYVK